MHSPQTPAGGPPASSAGAARAPSARAMLTSPRPPSAAAAAASRPPSAAAAAAPAKPPPTAAVPPPPLSSLPSPRAGSAAAAAAGTSAAVPHAPAVAVAAALAVEKAAAQRLAMLHGQDARGAMSSGGNSSSSSGSRPESPPSSIAAATAPPGSGHAVVPLVLPQQKIRAAHEIGGSSAGGDANAAANADNPPHPHHHPGFGPLDTTDPTLTTDAVVPPSAVLCDGDFHALYLLGDQLGQGSYGTVHRCERRSDGALFAVKVLALAGFRGEHRLPEIEDEVRLWLRVQDAHDAAAAEAAAPAAAPSPVVRLVSAHRDLTAAYLVQELCEAGDLQGVLDQQAAETVDAVGLEARTAAASGGGGGGDGASSSAPASPRPPRGFPGALPEPLAAAAMASALRFIAACHDAGVVFGDVKPSNFLLTLGDDDEEEEGQEGEEGGNAAAGATTTTPAERRKRRRLLRLRGADFGTALALPVDGVCSIHQGGCACADLAAFSLPTSSAGGGHGSAGGRAASPAVVAAAFAGNGSPSAAAASGSPPASPVYARECVPRRGLSGTPVYMAPELVRERRAGPAADVWAAGAMAYLLLTGRFPFWPDVDVADLARLPPARVLAEVAAAPLALEHPRATAHLSPEARGFLARLLERDPRRRVTARAALAHPFLAEAVAEQAASAAAALGGAAGPVVASR